MKVLFVDDEPSILDQAKIFLEKEDERLNIETALSAEEALQKLTINDYDAIVSDYQMPEMDGLDFLEIIRKEKELEIPFIVFTGKGREEVAMDALNLGANRYLQKGGNPKTQYGILSDAMIQEIERYRGMKERERMEERLKESVKRYRKLSEASPEAILIFDAGNGEIIDANQMAESLLKMPREKIIGSHYSILYPEEESEHYEKTFNDFTSEKGETRMKGVKEDFYIVDADGNRIPVEISAVMLELEGREVVQAFMKDVTKRKKAEERRRLLSSSLDQAAVEVYWITPEGEFVYSNETVRDRLGYSKEELSEIYVWDIVPNHDKEMRKKRWEMLKEEKTLKFESEHVTKNGERYPVEVTNYYIKHGRDEYEFAFARDITKRKVKEKNLNLFKNIGEKAPEAIFVSDEDGEIFYINDRACEILAYDKEELSKKKIYEFDVNLDPQAWCSCWKQVEKEGRVKAETEFVKKNGSKVPVELLITEIEHDQKEYHITFARDITIRKNSEERLQTLLDQAPEGVIVHDMEGDILFVNEQECKEKGYSKEELLSKNIKEIDPYALSEEHKERYWKKMSTGRSVRFETVHKRKDGSTYPAETTLTQIELDGKPVIVGFDRNISRRKEAEEKEEFLHSLLRHDVRNKAQIVQGYLELMEDYDLPEEVREYLENAKEGSKEGIEIIEKVRELREVGEEDIRGLKLNSVIEEVVRENRDEALESNMEIELESEFDYKVRGGDLMKELFTNIVTNSIQHSGGARIRISEEEKEDEVICRIEDDGKGISNENKKRVFEKGFKIGKTGESGLGLYLVKEIAESYGGRVEVYDSELGGVRFDVYLRKV